MYLVRIILYIASTKVPTLYTICLIWTPVTACKNENGCVDKIIWGEPERAPHKREFVRLVCLSVCTVMTRKYTRIVVIYGVPLVVDSSVYGAFGELLCMPTFNKHVVTNNKNKQVLILRKQVYRSLIKIISLALLLFSLFMNHRCWILRIPHHAI